MPEKLRRDETIRTVWNHLATPREYVAGVRHKMLQCQKKLGNAHVRIGVTGTGSKPCYRVFSRHADGSETTFNSYYDNHEELELGFADTGNWSTASMTFDEVTDFLVSKITIKGKVT